ncbi:hypothetical protein HNY73_002086 [Argiope bruennichi]|uniref:Uncharacterized protein n=1 Tax=Argiope bruennichi TaxID=94029 RepID=A0A8T0FUW2_ARGBR|nr:hypothetical protein HNY73_002086 [Argiope bruennichi]
MCPMQRRATMLPYVGKMCPMQRRATMCPMWGRCALCKDVLLCALCGEDVPYAKTCYYVPYVGKMCPMQRRATMCPMWGRCALCKDVLLCALCGEDVPYAKTCYYVPYVGKMWPYAKTPADNHIDIIIDTIIYFKVSAIDLTKSPAYVYQHMIPLLPSSEPTELDFACQEVGALLKDKEFLLRTAY